MTAIVVSGTRDGLLAARHRTVIVALVAAAVTQRGVTEIRHGGARGVDRVVAAAFPALQRTFRAAWHLYGDSAGPRRNREMFEAEPWPVCLLAFPGPGSRGTWDCVRAATDRGVLYFTTELS